MNYVIEKELFTDACWIGLVSHKGTLVHFRHLQEFQHKPICLHFWTAKGNSFQQQEMLTLVQALFPTAGESGCIAEAETWSSWLVCSNTGQPVAPAEQNPANMANTRARRSSQLVPARQWKEIRDTAWHFPKNLTHFEAGAPTDFWVSGAPGSWTYTLNSSTDDF